MAVPFFLPGGWRSGQLHSSASPFLPSMIEIDRIVACQTSPPEEAPGRLTELLAKRFKALRVGLWLHTPDLTFLFCCDLFDLTKNKHHCGKEFAVAGHEAFWSQLRKGEPVASADAPALNRTVSTDFAASDDTFFAPIIVSGQLAGLICIEHSSEAPHGSQDERLWLKAATDLPASLISTQQHIHSETKLKQAISLLSGTLESIGEGIVVTTMDRTITMANRRFLEIFGLATHDWHSLVGSNVRAVVLPMLKNPQQARADADLLYENPERQAIHLLELKDGRTIERYSQPQRIDNQIVGRIFSYRDISERVHSEQIRVRLEHQLQQSQKLEALGTLAGGIAHDFNNVLNVLTCNLEFLRSDLSPDHPGQTALDDIGTAVHRATELVGKILTFGRQQPGERRLIELQPVLLDAVKFIRTSLPADIELRTQVQENIPRLLADPTQIHQVLLNLCINAWHAIGNHPGSISVQAKSVTVSPLHASTSPDLRIGDYVVVSVRDTGCGMDEATLDHIFEPFFTTKIPGQGTGLGLSIVHGIMRAHQGTIIVSSVPNQGTEFLLYFPTPRDSATD